MDCRVSMPPFQKLNAISSIVPSRSLGTISTELSRYVAFLPLPLSTLSVLVVVPHADVHGALQFCYSSRQF